MPSDNSRTSTEWNPSLFNSILAAVVGGAPALAAVHWLYPFFPIAALSELGVNPSAEQLRIHLEAAIDFHSRNCAVTFGLLGLCLGLAFGWLTTVQRRVASAVVGGVSGSVAGTIAGYAAGYFLALALSASENQSLVQSTLFHFSVWAPMLVAAWGGIALIQRPISQTIPAALTGLLAALVGVTVYGLVGTMLFPTANLLYLVPLTVAERCAWMISCTLVSGIGLHMGLKPNQKESLPTNEQSA